MAFIFFFLPQLDYEKKSIDFFPGTTSHSSVSYACQAQGMQATSGWIILFIFSFNGAAI